MNKKHHIFSRISALLLVVVLLTASLTGCFFTSNFNNLAVVTKLAEDESIPEFDINSFANVELCFGYHYYDKLDSSDNLYNKTKAAFAEYFKDIDKSDKDAVTHALIDCYIYSIGDNYSFFRNPDELNDYNTDMGGSFVGIGVSVLSNSIENTILVTGLEPDSPAERAGILPDDYIIAVDGALVSEIGPQAATDKIKGEVGTSVTVTVKRGEEEISFTMTRALITETFVTYNFIENTKILHIAIKTFKGDDSNNTALQFREAVNFAEQNGAEGIIFDVRSNPGGYLHLVVDMLSYLVPTGTRIASFSTLKSDKEPKAPIYADNDGTEEKPYDHVLTLPSVVVCNKNSASASELFAGALRDYNDMGLLKSSSVGEVTYKKGIMQSTITFNNGSALTLTTALYNPPSGKNFHGVGVEPNVLLEDGDDFIAHAIAELNKLISQQ